MKQSKKKYLSAAVVAAAAVLLSTPASAQTAPTFGKAFSPATIGPAGVSTLTFSIDNGAAAAPAGDLAFTDNLPAGVTIASVANAAHDCGAGVLDAPAGGGSIGFSVGQVAALGSCSVSVDVTSATPGTHTNVSGDLTSNAGNSGTATADLTVATDRPGFTKSFSPTAVSFGGLATLTFTIDNTANAAAAVGLTFVDNLPPGMVVASPANAATTCGGGQLTAPAGGTVVSYGPRFTFGDASVGAGASCAVSVAVVGNSNGVLDNTSGELTSTAGSTTRSSGQASASLTVTTQKIVLTKSFTDDPAAPGGGVTLEFTIRNLSRTATATDIAFTDDLDAALSGLAATGLPAADVCGTGSSLDGTGLLSLTGGTLAPEATCTFSATLQVPPGAAAGTYTNTTSTISASLDGGSETGDAATGLLFIEPAPLLTKTFLGDPVGGGDSLGLEYTITNTSPTSAATDITFIDVLIEELPTGSNIPADGFCGAGSTATYTPLAAITSGSSNPARLVVAGAELAAGSSCTFSIQVDVSTLAAAGTYLDTSDEITATVDGQTLTGSPASDSFGILAAPSLFKEFTDDPAQAGGTVTVEYTVSYDENGNGDFDAPAAASDVTFMDDFDSVLSGLAATGLPATDVCGVGSTLSGGSTITLTGGDLALGESCTFSVTLQVPAGAASGQVTSTTSTIQATVLGVTTVGNAATDDLRIAGVALTKEFLDDPVIAGGTVTLRFTVENLSPTDDATDVFFTDDLGEVLAGLAPVAGALPLNDFCGTGSVLELAGTDLLVWRDSTVAAATTCSADVELAVPAGTPSDTYTNLTSSVSATIAGSTVVFDPAFDELTVDNSFLVLDKEFTDDPVAPGGTVNLRFTLENLSASAALTDVAFSDDLDAALSGLAATGLPAAACGGNASGTGVVDFSGGSLAPGELCSFDVAVTVPAGIPVGTMVVNTTTAVTGTSGGLTVTGDPASDELDITFVQFSKAFDAPVEQGGTVTLTFNIQNQGGQNADGLEFFDDLELVTAGLTAIGLPAADVCGAGSTLDDSSGVLELSGGSVLAGGSCSFSVDLTVPAATAPGGYDNVTSDLRANGALVALPATATLTVLAPVDSDGDGVLDGADLCADTVIPESVPTQRLGNNRYALIDGDNIFEYGGGPGPTLTTLDTGGCSCEQIIVEMGLGQGHVKFGCSKGAMEDWIDLISGGGGSGGSSSSARQGRGSAPDPRGPEVYAGPKRGLTLEVEGPGGSVTSGSVELAGGDRLQGLVCGGGSCNKRFPQGVVVKLMARPDSERFEFVRWSGDCTGTTAIINVTLDAATRCVAEFRAIDE